MALRTPVIERIHPETRPCDQIFAGLAEACGVGEYFDFTVEELAEAQLASVGTSIEEVREAGIVELADPGFAFGTPTFKVGGFEGGFNLVKTFDHTNASGATVSYDVWQSTNAGLGNTTVNAA